MMNKDKKQVLETALEKLARDVRVTRAEWIVELRADGGDFRVTLKLPGQESTQDFSVEVKRHSNSPTIGGLARRRMRLNTSTILVADYITRN